MEKSKTTPMMQQYNSIRKKYPDAILFFRLGDFYEMFNQDAHEVSALLNITLTKRNGISMCGIPYHAAQTYIARLLKMGRKIAMCEQVSLPKDGKGIAKRDVVEIITPGTVIDENYLDNKVNNYLVSIGVYKKEVSFSYIDLSTAEFAAAVFSRHELGEKMRKELLRLDPREILIQESLFEMDKIQQVLEEFSGLVVNRIPDWSFDVDTSREILLNQFKTANLKGFGFEDDSVSIVSAGVILSYLQDTAKTFLEHIKGITKYVDSEFVILDESTQKNLELVRNLNDGSRKYTLLDILDYTKTSMGARRLRKAILNPLRDVDIIKSVQKQVDFFYHNQRLLTGVRENLGNILDIERLSARVAMNRAHAKDMLSLNNSLTQVLTLWKINEDEEFFYPWKENPSMYESIVFMEDLLNRSIAENPSVILTEGKMIREGYDAGLDELRRMRDGSKDILNQYIEKERGQTGISTLKVKYNKIIGYFLDVTKTNQHLVPDHFILRQTLVGSHRYTTTELADLESKLNNASEKIIELEKQLFTRIREQVKEYIPVLLELAGDIAFIDTIESFAYSATEHGYVKPKVEQSQVLHIDNGRHPVVEECIPPGEFVPNSITINGDEEGFCLITGPNMAGKSTVLRQTALITLMAQIGSFVPADSAEIGIVDRIFCRVGASDNLARGESTFLVEMNEAANILRSASKDSLIIMDEVGRGTSTNDGLSIAWAISEYLMNDVKAKTLFATHYHELTLLENERLQNLTMDVIENQGEVIFLKKIKKGSSSNSYGIHVAGLAGLPEKVIKRARAILKEINAKNSEEIHILSEQGAAEVAAPAAAPQQNLFSNIDMLQSELASINISNLTPLEALNKIAAWQKEYL